MKGKCEECCKYEWLANIEGRWICLCCAVLVWFPHWRRK